MAVITPGPATDFKPRAHRCRSCALEWSTCCTPT
jgi:hypothetical protein